MTPTDKAQLAFIEGVVKVAGQKGVTLDPAFVSQVAAGMKFGQSPGGAPQAPGVYNRLKSAVSYLVSGVTPATWFGPWQPITPQAQAPEQGVIGRQFDYPTGYNLAITPRAYDDITFPVLRAFGDNYDLLRLAIETCKDQIESFSWEIIPEDPKANADQFKDEIKRVTAFWEYPDKEHNWSQWLRMFTEDLLVLDAVSIFPTQTRGGGLYSLDLIDSATIARTIDQYGRTPMPPSPAYRQIIKGMPAVDYTRDDLIYMVRNPRTNRLYGYSPVNQVLTTVNIAMRRQMMQLEEYTMGSIPDALISVPDDWTSDQIKNFQDWFDTILSGQTGERKKARFIPNVKGIEFTKQAVLKDEYDDWLARIICWSLSISPTALIKGVNRASSEQMAETAKEEGQVARLKWIAGMINDLNRRCLKTQGVKFEWKTTRAVDPFKAAQVHQIYVQEHVLTADEVREDLGRDSMTPEEREAAFPKPPEPSFGFGGGGGFGKPAPKPGEPPAKTDDKSVEDKPTFKIDVHMPAQPAPVVNMGDTFVRVAPPDVTMGSVNVTQAPPAQAPVDNGAVRKVFRGRRNPTTGDMEAELVLVVDNEPQRVAK